MLWFIITSVWRRLRLPTEQQKWKKTKICAWVLKTNGHCICKINFSEKWWHTFQFSEKCQFDLILQYNAAHHIILNLDDLADHNTDYCYYYYLFLHLFLCFFPFWKKKEQEYAKKPIFTTKMSFSPWKPLYLID